MQIEISDPIHHYIYLSDLEKDIVDTPVFQRLRRIRQLAGAHLTYPSANHTRFEHSLGVKHLADFATDILYEKEYICKDDIERVRLAALLHDVGHGPFSHIFEEVINQIHHEDFTYNIIKRTLINDILNKYGYSSEEIAALARGRSNNKFLNEVISGILSVDVMDYLPRDSYFTGTEHGRVDSERIIRSYEVFEDEDRLALNKSALYSLESLMISRYQMFKAVYFHRSVRAAQVMLLHSILYGYKELSLDEKVKDPESYISLTDDLMLGELLHISNDHASRLAKDYLDRRLLKCVYEEIIQSNEKVKPSLEDLKNRIIEVTKVEDIYIDIPSTSSLSLTPTKDIPSEIILVHKKEYEKKKLEDLPLIKSILGYMNMIRIYTRAEDRDKVEVKEAEINEVLKEQKIEIK